MYTITFRQLEIFVAVVKHGSFRRAGEHIGISQVAVSEHVRALEDRLGQALFERRAGGPAKLTAAGELAHARSVELLGDAGDFVEAISSLGRTGGRVVRVAIPAFLVRDLSERLALFRAEHPHVDLQLDLDDNPIDSVSERVTSRELDLAYCFAFEEGDAPGSELVRNEELAIFVGHNHPMALRALVRADELGDVPAVHLSRRRPMRQLIERALQGIGADGGEVAFETDEFGLVLSTVHRNQGFVCMFKATENEEGQTFGLKRVELSPALAPLQVRLLMRRAAAGDHLLTKLRAIFETRR